jgi:hypothetical protein
MSRLRLRARWRDRAELHELPGPDVIVGSDPSCDLVLDHRSVAPNHAKVLLRRGRVIVADLGRAPTGVTRGIDRLSAPVTLNAGDEVGIGEISLSGFVDEQGPEDPTGFESTALVGSVEIDSPDPETRRFRGRFEDRPGELLAIGPRLDVGSWLARAQRLATINAVDDRIWTAFQPLTPGLRLERLLLAVGEGRLALPAEALVVAAVLPGPIDDFRDPRQEAFLAPERRYGQPPTIAADRYGAGLIARHLVADLGLADDALSAFLAEEPADRPTDPRAIADALLARAHAQGLDPTGHHLGRVVQLLDPSPEGRFSYSGRARETLPKSAPTG